MKYKHIAYTLVLALTGTLAQAQVKIGKNPTTIAPGAVLDIEGTTTHTVSLTNGNFGIGTTTPISALDVNGGISFSSNAVNGLVVGGSGSLYLRTGSNSLNIDNNAGTSNLVTVTNAGRVGIGVTTPINTLDIAGGLGFSGNAVNGLVAGGSGILTMRTGSGSLHIDNNAGSANLVAVTDGGTVGIGTTAPTAKLDIIGNVRIADGTQGAGKVLTSDANGLASWQNLNSQFIPKVVFAGRTPAEYTVAANSTFRIPLVNGIATPGYDAGSNEFVIQESGFYKLSGGATFIGSAETTGAYVRIYVSTPIASPFAQFDNITGGQKPSLTTSWDGYYNAGDRISLNAQSGGTGSQTVRIINLNAYLTAIKLY